MRVSKEQATANRERIVEVAGKLFRENGFDGIGVADLARGRRPDAWRVYGRFRSKDDLAAEACSRTCSPRLRR
jgi:TetR/AcrR family transcriptional repressor of nem operon